MGGIAQPGLQCDRPASLPRAPGPLEPAPQGSSYKPLTIAPKDFPTGPGSPPHLDHLPCPHLMSSWPRPLPRTSSPRIPWHFPGCVSLRFTPTGPGFLENHSTPTPIIGLVNALPVLQDSSAPDWVVQLVRAYLHRPRLQVPSPDKLIQESTNE